MYNIMTLKQLSDKLYIHGRTRFDGNALALSWSGSGFSLKCVCDRMVIAFAPYSDAQSAYVAVTVDGSSEMKFAVTNGSERIVLEGLCGEHEIELLRLTEGENELKITAIELDGGICEFREAPEPAKIKMEFYGDSITCGYGDLGNPETGCFYTYEEDVTRSYAFQTARAFNADARFVCISGQGIVKCCNGDIGLPIPEFAKRISRSNEENIDFSLWQPDFVVINAGTNDCPGGVTKEEFFNGAVKFLKDIRHRYPLAKLIWFYGMMGEFYSQTIENAVRAVNDEHIHYLPTKPITRENDEVGANGHPNVNGQLRAARELSDFICRLML